MGIDALDYDLVEKWDLINLKQKVYGKIEVPIDEQMNQPSSPTVWASFLTGKVTQVKFTKSIPLLRILLRIGRSLKKYLLPDWGKEENIKLIQMLHKIGIETSSHFGELKDKTFLDYTNSQTINAPFYNYNHSSFKISHRFAVGDISLAETIELIKRSFKLTKNNIFEKTSNIGSVSVIFAYIHELDMIQHLVNNNIEEVRKHYFDLDDYVSTLRKRISPEFFIIVSDHGTNLKDGSHSDHGFYSSSRSLDSTPQKITDFFGLIIDLEKHHDF